MTEEAVEFNLRATGVGEVTAAFDQTGKSIATTSGALQELNAHAGAGQEKLQNVAGAIGLMSGGLRDLNPQVGELTQVTAGAVSQFTSLVNQMGVAGGAIAIAATAVTAFAHDLAELHAAEQAEAQAVQAEADARHAHIASVREEVQAIQQRAQAQQDNANINERIRAGTASLVEIQAHYHQELERQNLILQANRTAHEQLEKALHDELHSGLALPSTIHEAERALEDNERATDAAAEAVHRLDREERQAIQTNHALAGSIGKVTDYIKAQAAAQQQLLQQQEDAVTQALSTAATRHHGGGHRPGLDLVRMGIQFSSHAGETTLDVGGAADREAQKEMERSAAIGRAEAERDARRRARAEEQKQFDERAFQRRMDHLHQESQAIGDYGGRVADIFVQAAKTQGEFAKAVAVGFGTELQGLGQTELVKGLSDEAEAIGLSFVNPAGATTKATSGAQHLAISAIAYAAGAALGAAGASGSGAGGAGSGGGATSAARPSAVGGDRGGEGGVTNIYNITPGMMVVAGSRAEGGRILGGMIRDGTRRYGD